MYAVNLYGRVRSCLELCSEKALLDKSNVGEDAPVTGDGGEERQHHAGDDEEHGVVVGGCPVP